MPGRAIPRWRLTTLLVCGAAAFIFAACDSVFLHRGPEEVTVWVRSEDVDAAEVVTSMNFFRTADGDVALVEADTAAVALPFRQTWGFTSRQRFFVETYLAGADTATLSLRVDIDGKTWYDDFRTLTSTGGEEGGPETLRFVYEFTEPSL